ncbi:uncharacterized protein LOC124373350 [Homalodisca vitripennis]|uniref:uncharacterized protein LOC124373350 n=1 Tax=Homalodisca vitripennis TaxID=197043 RepID=UPI001EEBBE17|nr:uncharacterized protein LOC124373350 [Homalodisca vitripennis]
MSKGFIPWSLIVATGLRISLLAPTVAALSELLLSAPACSSAAVPYRPTLPFCDKDSIPLTSLIKKRKSFEWTQEAQEAFQEIKSCLVTAPILSCPDFTKPFTISCDASGIGLGAVLSQSDERGLNMENTATCATIIPVDISDRWYLNLRKKVIKNPAAYSQWSVQENQLWKKIDDLSALSTEESKWKLSMSLLVIPQIFLVFGRELTVAGSGFDVLQSEDQLPSVGDRQEYSDKLKELQAIHREVSEKLKEVHRTNARHYNLRRRPPRPTELIA